MQKSLPELYINQIATFKRIKYTCVMSIVYHKEWLELNRQSTKEQIDNYLKNNRTKILHVLSLVSHIYIISCIKMALII